MAQDTLAETLRGLSEGDEVCLDFDGRTMAATVSDIDEHRENMRGSNYYRNGICIDRTVTFETTAGEMRASCFWWPNHDDDDLQMNGGLQVPFRNEDSDFDLPAYGFSIHVSSEVDA